MCSINFAALVYVNELKVIINIDTIEIKFHLRQFDNGENV